MDTPSVRASAVADANVVKTLVSNDRDPINHLGPANVRVEQDAGPKLVQHLRVRGPIDIRFITRNVVSHVRLAVGVAAAHRHRCGIDHNGVSGFCPMPLPYVAPGLGTRTARRTARAAGRCRPCPRRKANRPRRQANRPRRRPLPPLPAPQGESPAPPGEPLTPPAVAAVARAAGRIACAATRTARAAGHCRSCLRRWQLTPAPQGKLTRAAGPCRSCPRLFRPSRRPCRLCCRRA